jgi:hypothetical protein
MDEEPQFGYAIVSEGDIDSLNGRVVQVTDVQIDNWTGKFFEISPPNYHSPHDHDDANVWWVPEDTLQFLSKEETEAMLLLEG